MHSTDHTPLPQLIPTSLSLTDKHTGLNAQSKFIRENEKKYEGRWGKDALRTFEKCFFQSMSLAAQHADAYVLTPRDTPWKEDSAWVSYNPIRFPPYRHSSSGPA